MSPRDITRQRCCHNITRNGYWTGRQCSRYATKAVAVAAIPGNADLTKYARHRLDGTHTLEHLPMCGQHANAYGNGVCWHELEA